MRRLVLLLVAPLFLAGCGIQDSAPQPIAVAHPSAPVTTTTTTTSAPSKPVRHLDPKHVTTEGALGDITMVDPCSLVRPNALPSRFGKAQPTAADNLDDCELYAPNGGTPLYADLGMLEDYATAAKPGVLRSLPRSGGMRIAVLQDDSALCDEVLVFADGVTMDAAAWPAKATSATHLCDLATALLDQAITTIKGAGPKHRDYATDSLAHQDACKLLTSADAGLAVRAAHAVGRYPARHRCAYQAGTGPWTQVTLDFGVFDDRSDSDSWTADVIDDKFSMIQADPHPGAGLTTYCAVGVKALPINQPGLDFTTEAAVVFVRVEHTKTPPCAQARKVAAAVWRKLP